MDTTRLEKGNELKKKLEDLKQHLQNLESHKERFRNNPENIGGFFDKPTLQRGHPSYSDKFELWQSLFPISQKEFIAMYELKLKGRIEEVQKEFDSL